MTQESQWDPNDTNDPRNWPGGGAVCPQCGVALTPENEVSIVIDKGEKPIWGEERDMSNAPIFESMCRKCAGIPEGL